MATIQEAIDQGKYQEALVLVDAAEGNDTSELLNFKGLALMRLGSLEEAATCFKQAMELDPTNTEADANRKAAALAITTTQCDAADNLFRAGKMQEAIDAYATIESSPAWSPAEALTKFQVLNNKGAALMNVERPQEAAAAFRAAVDLQPLHGDASHNLAAALKASGLAEEAAVEYDRCVQLRPQFFPAECGKAEALAALNRIDEALAVLEGAIGRNPEEARGYADRAFCHLKSGAIDEAIADYEKAGLLGDRSDEHKRLLAIALGQQADTLAQAGDNSSALEAYDKALANGFGEPNQDLLFNRALCLLHLDQKSRALEAFQEVTTTNPENYNAQRATGLLALQTEDPALAITALTAAVAGLPADTDARFNLGLAFAQLKPPQTEEALKHIRRVLQQNPNHAQALQIISVRGPSIHTPPPQPRVWLRMVRYWRASSPWRRPPPLLRLLTSHRHPCRRPPQLLRSLQHL